MPKPNENDFTQRITRNTVYLTDISPIGTLLHAADRLIATSEREPDTKGWGFRPYGMETSNAIELIRQAMTDIIHELAAKSVPTSAQDSPLTTVKH